MEYNLFKEILNKKAKEIQIELNEDQLKKFYKYMELLIEWNEKINLTAIIEPEEIITKHFIDSLTIQKKIQEESKIIDVGTGAGFPGIPLKILREDIEVVLLDSLNKRIIFLQEVIRVLELNNIEAIHGRAEELGRQEYREVFDVSVSRAVASLGSLLEYMSPLVKVDGKIICMKGPKLTEELEESKDAIRILGLEIEEIEKINLPNTDMERNILIINKKEKTKKEYPRKAVNIRKSPLQPCSTKNPDTEQLRGKG